MVLPKTIQTFKSLIHSINNMAEIDERIDQLQARLENLVNYQAYFGSEISQIRYEINVLRAVQQKRNAQTQEIPKKPPVREYVPPPRAEQTSSQQTNRQTEQSANPPTNQQSYQQAESPNFGYSTSSKSSSDYKAQPIQPKEKSDLEKFIGENLISKIGIVILVLGVAIGAKYAIDNNLISPLTRIVLGYIFGFGLLGFAVKLKAKYHNFSAVLLSGAMAIMYFITYFAYDLYELFSQSSAFVLMLIFTVFTVAAAINYSRQIIAHIGLVGAYAVPFLLSDDSGNFAFLFTFIAIINVGILAVSVKKYWKPLFYTSFIFTWATYYGWYLTKYQTEHFNLALLFLTVFFLTFYITFIVYKLISKENVAIENIVLILSNSFIFYGLGYSILNNREGFENFLGIFTVANAAIHFGFALTVSRMKIFPSDLLYLLTALVLTFATISIPVQLDGNFVTLLWTAEAAILFWIGRTKQIPLYENYSYPLMFLATVSLLLDWQAVSDFRLTAEILQNPYPLLNGTFVTSIVFVIAFAFIHFLNKDERFEPSIAPAIGRILSYVIPAVALCVLYNAFRMEIGNYFHHQLAKNTDTTLPFGGGGLRTDNDLNLFNIIWQINYTMLFLTVLSFVSMKRWKSLVLAFANLALNIFVLIIFLTVGLYLLGELRESYLLQTNADIFHRGIMHILIRYFSYAFVGGLIFALYKYIKQDFLHEVLPENLSVAFFDFVLYFSLWLVVSSELINWMDILGYRNSHKLGLSILWGIYALFLIILGIYQSKKHLRIGAIALFGITLAKLFLYDIAELDTISKTIVFVSLGILMLIVSFLYNKYKSLIFDGGNAEV